MTNFNKSEVTIGRVGSYKIQLSHRVGLPAELLGLHRPLVEIFKTLQRGAGHNRRSNKYFGICRAWLSVMRPLCIVE